MFIRALNVLLAKARNGQSPIYPGQTVEVDDEVGRAFVGLKAAVEVSSLVPQRTGKGLPAASPDGNTPKGEGTQNGLKTGENVTGYLDGSDLEGMSFADLKALAKDMGIDTGKIRSKTGMIEAISSVEVEAPLTEEDDLPDLTPQDVVDE